MGLAQTLYFLGVVIGMLVFGILSDMYGRYKHKQTNDTHIHFITQCNYGNVESPFDKISKLWFQTQKNLTKPYHGNT